MNYTADTIYNHNTETAQEVSTRLCNNIMGQIEVLLKKRIEKYIGHSYFKIEEISNRLCRIVISNENIFYYIDNHCLLQTTPLEISINGNHASIKVGYR